MLDPFAVWIWSALSAGGLVLVWRYGFPVMKGMAGGLFVVQRQLAADRDRIVAQLRGEIADLQRQLDREIGRSKAAEARITELESALADEREFTNRLLTRLGWKRSDIMKDISG